MNSIPIELQPEIDELIRRSMNEDVREGDHSSLSCISADTTAKARLLVKEDCVLAGVSLAKYIFEHAIPGSKVSFHSFLNDGDTAKTGDTAFIIESAVHTILTLERLVLNCMQRMSGIATATREMVSEINDLHTKLLDTRKTTPGIRFLEKWAVRIGGGYNHRFGLFDMIMLKDNHIDAAGGITKAIQAAKEYLKKNNLNLPVEVETRNLQEVKEAVETGGITHIMLDNFSPEEIREALKIINNRVETEASGGITMENLREYALTGVDYISTSKTIHSVKSVDLSLKIMKD